MSKSTKQILIFVAFVVALMVLGWLWADGAMGATASFTVANMIDDQDYGYNTSLENCTARDVDSLKCGYSGSGVVWWGWEAVFDNIQVHKNATVSAASLQVQTKVAMVAGATEGLHAYVGVLQADNKQTVDGCYGTEPTWSYDNSSWTANETIDITLNPAEFQTLFARSGWSNGNSLTISMIDAQTSDRIMFLKSSASFAITLTLTFTNPAATSDSLQKTITDGDRDGESLEGGTLTHGGETMYSGSADPEDNGIVLIPQSVTIPQYAEGDSIVVWMYANATNSSTAVKSKLFFEDASTSVDLTDGTNFWARPFTTAWYDYTFPAITINTWYRIKFGPAAMNEVLDRGDWSSGGNMLLWINNDGTTGANRKGFEQYDEGGGHVALITFFWHTATATAGVPPRRPNLLKRQ